MSARPPRPRTKSFQMPDRPGWRMLLGDLEADIMEYFWSRPGHDWVAGRDVWNALSPARRSAYTTVTTVMANLAQKGLLTVDKSAMTHHYKAVVEREEFTRQRVDQIVDRLLTNFPEQAMARFVKATRAAPQPMRKELTRLIAQQLLEEG